VSLASASIWIFSVALVSAPGGSPMLVGGAVPVDVLVGVTGVVGPLDFDELFAHADSRRISAAAPVTYLKYRLT